jgi:hypothetical protein
MYHYRWKSSCLLALYDVVNSDYNIIMNENKRTNEEKQEEKEEEETGSLLRSWERGLSMFIRSIFVSCTR